MYNLETVDFSLLYDSKAIDMPIEYVPVREMGLKLKCKLPPKFVVLVMMIELRSIRSK